MRLTEKFKDNYWDKTELNYNQESKSEIIDKLGQLEDIEEELGIDLITVFKILKAVNIYTKDKRYDLRNSLSYMGNSWVIQNHYDNECFDFKDYGKTWSIKKEDLE